MAEPASDEPSLRMMLQAAGMTPGVWMGIGGYVLLVVASFLPWYNITAQVPSVPDFRDPTTIIQFDGMNGLYVHDRLKIGLGLGVPNVGFPIAIFFVLSAILKIRKIIRSNQHKMRAATLTRSSIAILMPFGITLAIIFALPSIIPATSPADARALAEAVAAQPFGGSHPFTFTPDESNPLVTVSGTLWWGFGPALYLMVVAAVIMNVGSQLEMRLYRRVTHELEMEAAEAREGGPGP